MSPKPRPTIPRSARWKGAFRRWFRATVRDIRELRGKPESKARSGGEEVGNSWVRCTTCHRRQPPTAYVCEEHAALWMCGGCCGGPHDEDDEHEDDEQAPDQAKDAEESEER